MIQIMRRDYQPFAYPPDYSLARQHQQATMPGTIPPSPHHCPCCSQPLRQPFSSWVDRDIDKDFHRFGGSVVTYFWLLRLYAFIVGIVVMVYSVYLMVVTHQYCNDGEDLCQRLLFVWIVSNQNLYTIMKAHGDTDTIVRLWTLRGIAYGILLIGNAAALYVVGRFKRRYPKPKGISTFSLIFKNLQIEDNAHQLVLMLKEKYPHAALKALALSKLEPYYTAYNTKLELYYTSLVEHNPKKQNKMVMKLAKMDKECDKHEKTFNVSSDRAIIVFEDEGVRNMVLGQHKQSVKEKMLDLVGCGDRKMFCEPCPPPNEIIWNHIGLEERQKIKVKILSIIYFFLLLGASYVLLFFCLHLVYRPIFAPIISVILTNIILIFVVVIALTFRVLMNHLSEMRYPNTQTSRSMFIIVTTVLFHFVYYLIIPTIYFVVAEDKLKNKTLLVVTNQTINFLVIQFILAQVDLMYCFWSRRQAKVENKEKAVGCQRILHRQIQYPRFPIEFKLIILFKTFSFIIFFAFQVPIIMFMTFLLLVYLYYKDKHSVYYHYRMEIIANDVQFKFLRIYANFFSFYTFLIFALTQHMEEQFWIAFGLMIASMIVQTFVIKEQKHQDEDVLPESFEELGLDTGAYQKPYRDFIQAINCDPLDLEIKEYLADHGHASLQTEYEGREKLL